MGANYNFIIVGNQYSKGLSWTELLLLSSELTHRLVGAIVQVMVLDPTSGVELHFEVGDRQLEDHKNIAQNEIIFFYPEGNGCLGFSTTEEHWQFSMSLPASDSFDSSFGAKTLIDLWNCLSTVYPRFAAAGEELSLRPDEIEQVFHGKLNLIDLDLCDMAIVSNASDQNETRYETIPISESRFIRKRHYP